MASQALAVVSQFDSRQIEIIRRTVAVGVPEAEFAFFLEVCKHRNLDPFNREIYGFMGSGGKLTIQVSIDGLRLIAERSGKYRGQIGPLWCGDDAVWHEEWLLKTPPTAAKVGVLREGFLHPVWAVARFESYYQDRSPVWKKMPDHMLAKCAESLALRRAFPAEMGGLYTHEEMAQAGNTPLPPQAPQEILSKLEELKPRAVACGVATTYASFYDWMSTELGFAVVGAAVLSMDNLKDIADRLYQIELQQASERKAS
jgi:phage recombination protein Bet